MTLFLEKLCQEYISCIILDRNTKFGVLVHLWDGGVLHIIYGLL